MFSQEKDRIRLYWNARAKDYSKETGHGFQSAEDSGLWGRVITRYLRRVNGNKALDLGTGPGHLAILLAQLGYESQGLDMSEEMLTIARRRAQQLGLSIDFQQGDVEEPPFAGNSMDLIVCRHIMWTLTDLRKVVGVWKDILKENGQLIVIDGVWNPKTAEGILRQIAGNVIRTFQEKKWPTDWKKKYVQDRRYLPYLGGAPPKVVIEALQANGFKRIQHDPLDEILAFEQQNGSLAYRIQFAHNPRYLITGMK